MSHSIYRPDSNNMVENFATRNTFHDPPSGDYYTMIRREGTYYQQRHQIGLDGKPTNIDEKSIDYVIGSGDQARSYLHIDPEGRLIELPITWYSEKGGYWAMTPGYEAQNQKDFHGTVSKDCIFCHDAYPLEESKDIQSSGEPIFRNLLPQGIDCQRCHGPGANHVKAAKSNNSDIAQIQASIINPMTLDRSRQLEICMECHLSTSGSQDKNISVRFNRDVFSYHPGEPLSAYKLYFDTPQPDKSGFEIADAAYRLRMSKCFQQSQMTCLSCHDPHGEDPHKKTESAYLKVCQSCHQNVAHKISLPKTETCLSCHMPKRRGEYATHIVLTDHYIQRVKPSNNLLAPPQHTDTPNERQEKLVPYYPASLSDDKDRLYEMIAEAESGDPLTHAEQLAAAINKYSPAEAGFYSAAGNIYANAGNVSQAAAWFTRAQQKDPANRGITEQLAESLIAKGDLARAQVTLEHAVTLPPPDARLLANLGNVYARQGKLSEAESTLGKSLAINPELAETYNLLGLVKQRRGDNKEAERLYREAIRYRPDMAEARSRLASLLIADGHYDESAFQFERAIASSPSFAEARHDYGLLLIVTRRHAEAESELREAVRLDPNNAMFHSDLADVLAQQRNDREAKEHYEAALRINPALDVANLGLGFLLARQGDTVSSRFHCEAALKSNDGDIREQAQACLSHESP
jgi:Flp pilus assembly protein TadD